MRRGEERRLRRDEERECERDSEGGRGERMIGRRRYRAEPKRRAVVPSRARVLAKVHTMWVSRARRRAGTWMGKK